MELSKKSRDFLDDLAIYLLSSGKSEHDVIEVTEELRDHLEEAERAGKDVDDVIGQHPEAYMRQMGGEMEFDRKGLFRVLGMIIPSVFAYIVIGDAIQGAVSYSLVQLLGYPTVAVLFLFAVAQVFRHLAMHPKDTKIKQTIIYILLGSTPLLLFVGLILLDAKVDTPTVVFGNSGTYVVLAIAIATLLIVSFVTKTWINLIIPVLLYTPQYMLAKTSMPIEQQLLISLVITMVGISIVMLGWIWLQKNIRRQS